MSADFEMKRMGVRRDAELYQYVVNAYRRSKKYIESRNIFTNAERYSKMYENEPYEAHSIWRPSYLSKVKIAIAFDVIETGLPVATSRPPMPDVEPELGDETVQGYDQLYQISQGEGPEADAAAQALEAIQKEASDYAEKLQQELIKIWKETKMQAVSRIAYREKGKVGIAVLRSVFDPSANEIVNTLCDLNTIYPSPNAESIEAHKDEPFIYAVVMSLDKIRRLYGIEGIDKAAVGEFDDEKKFSTTTQKTGYMGRVYAAIKTLLENTVTWPSGSAKKAGHAMVLECYMPDSSEMEYETEIYDDETGERKINDDGSVQVEKRMRQRFASGAKRVTIILGHEDWIVEESENPFGRPPFFENVNYRQSGDFYGISEIAQIEDLALRVNLMASNVTDNIRFTGNPKMVIGEGTRVSGDDNAEITNEPGQILVSPNPAGVRFLEPPRLGNDVKWWLEYLKNWVDRITHLSDALRGFNQFSEDSGRKIRELRAAATGTFQPKLDEQVEWIREIFKHWAFIIQNMRGGVNYQKQQDEMGNSSYVRFDAAAGRQFKMNIDVSAESILPDDPYSEWDESLALFERGALSPEQLIDAAPTLKDKARAKKWLARQQEKADAEKMKERAFEQFKQISAGQTEGMPAEAENETFAAMLEVIKGAPELMTTPEFAQLPDRVRLALVAAFSDSAGVV